MDAQLGEAARPAGAVHVDGPGAREAVVEQHDLGARAEVAELDGDERLARVGNPRDPLPRVDEALGRDDLAKLADEVHRTGLEDELVAAAGAQVDVGARRLVSAGAPPALQLVRLRPGGEDALARRVEYLDQADERRRAHGSARRRRSCRPAKRSRQNARWSAIHASARSSGAGARRT